MQIGERDVLSRFITSALLPERHMRTFAQIARNCRELLKSNNNMLLVCVHALSD